MLKQVMTKPGIIEFCEVDMPKIKDDEVLVKIMRIGICGSDLHVYHGEHPFTSYPVTQGHEVSGLIVELGGRVKGLTLGQRVTIEPQVTCGTCYLCRGGRYNLCENLKVMGFQTTGTASEYFAVHVSKITPLPDNMSFDEGAMIEPLAVAVHAAQRYEDLEDSAVVVLGAGPIGILTAQACKALGADKVMITDISNKRLEIAKNCGDFITVNTKTTELSTAIDKHFGVDKADVIFDCAGNDITINEAINCARKGSTIVLIAVFAKMANVNLAVLNDKQLVLDTSMMYKHGDYLTAIELVQNKEVNLRPLMSKHFPFREFLDAYKYIEENKEDTMKVFIDVDC